MFKRFVALMLALIMAVPFFGSVSAFEENLNNPEDDSAEIPTPTFDQPEEDYTMLEFELSDDRSFYSIVACNMFAVSVTIPESYEGLPVEAIEDGAFYGCEALESVKIPETVTYIGTEAFKYCGSLKEVTLPEGLIAIGDEAFSNCSALESIMIPASVRDIGGWVFAFCDSLESISVSEDNEKFYSVDNCIIDGESKALISGCNGSVIPDDGSVIIIGYAAFAGFRTIGEIVIPQSVVEIEDSAFSHCAGLESIEIPSTVNKIGAFVFAECGSLSEIHCEVAEKPAEWSSRWADFCDATIYWAGIPEEKPEIPEDSSVPSEDNSDESVDESEDSSDDESEDESEDLSKPTDDQIGDDEDKTPAKGDISGNGIIDSMDYIYLKRAYFGTYTLRDITIGDLSGNGIIDSMDYVYLKRAYFGTYKIK